MKLDKEIKNATVSHKPVAEGKCQECHNAHPSNSRYQLKNEYINLCYSCHKEKQKEFSEYKEKHPPVAEGQCNKCHDAHGTNIKSLLLKEQIELCISSCHKDREYYLKNKYVHEPVKQGNCIACHKPHGSQFTKYFTKDFPKESNVSFEENKYDLCFEECHKKGMILELYNTTVTDFRNGIKNLHYTHVNKKKNGLTCVKCHEMHASNQEKLIRVLLPPDFGNGFWVGIDLEKTVTGGMCIPKCHKPRAYNRENPISEKDWY